MKSGIYEIEYTIHEQRKAYVVVTEEDVKNNPFPSEEEFMLERIAEHDGVEDHEWETQYSDLESIEFIRELGEVDDF